MSREGKDEDDKPAGAGLKRVESWKAASSEVEGLAVQDDDLGGVTPDVHTEVEDTPVAMDHAADGFNLSQEALDTLTNNNAVQDGTVQVDAVRVDKSACGL